MFNFIADYRDPAGREYHQAFQVSAETRGPLPGEFYGSFGCRDT